MNDNPLPNQIAEEVTQHQSKNVTHPPVSDWNPPFSGEIDIRIAADGRWYHEGSPIGREALVYTFASILRREEDGCYYLVTPTEKFRLQVEDAPFTVIQLEAEGTGTAQQLTFITNVGDRVLASRDFPVRVKTDGQGNPRPYILVRQNLTALISRNVFYQLADLAEEVEKNGRKLMGVWSAGDFFELGESENSD